ARPEVGPLTLAGGRGERFWPWSTPARPKQLLPLAPGGRTLLAATFARAARVVPPQRIVVMTSAPLVAACRRECPGAIVVGEPVGRDTPPALAAAAAVFALGAGFAVLSPHPPLAHQAALAAHPQRALRRGARPARAGPR